MNDQNLFFGWAIVFATFFGPIFAVLLTRWIDSRRDQHNRRLHIYRTLMATRRTFLSPEHVNALNLIELEFHGKAKAIAAWKEYFKSLNTPFDPKDTDRVVRERQGLLAKMLSEMSKVIGIDIEQLDIFEGGYVPQRAVDVETKQLAALGLLADLAEGKRALPIEIRVGFGAQSKAKK